MSFSCKQLLCVVGVILTTTVVCAGETERDQARKEYTARYKRIEMTQRRINQTKPRRRDYPARTENISDDEIREIEYVTHEIFPQTLVNIGTVVSGCPCEDGAKCTAQVWLSAIKNDKTYELQLSRINDKWMVGPIQQWWRDYERWNINNQRRLAQLRKSPPSGSFPNAYEGYDELVEKFPICEKRSKNLSINEK